MSEYDAVLAASRKFNSGNIAVDQEIASDAVSKSFNVSPNFFVKRIRLSAASVSPAAPILLYLPKIRPQSKSFFVFPVRGHTDAVLHIVPDAANSINSLAAGDPYIYTSTSGEALIALVGAGATWHLGVFGASVPQQVTLTSAGGCTIGGSYPDFTISVP